MPRLKETSAVFQNEFLPHANAIFNFALSMSKHREQAEDLVQETMLKAFKYQKNFESGTNAKSWLFRIAQNIFINEYRKKSKRPNQVDIEEITTYNKLVDRAPQAFDNSFSDPVALALNSLQPDLKTIIILSDVEGFSYEEISKILDLPMGTVKTRIHRARNKMKEKLVNTRSNN